MNDSEQKSGNAFVLETVLEAPPSQQEMVGAPGMLFNEEAMAVVLSKHAITERLLILCTKDVKFSEFMREILLCSLAVVKSEAGSILELNPKSNCLFFRSVVGSSSDQVVNYEIPMGQGVVGHVAESKQPLVVVRGEENDITLQSIQKAVGFEPRNLIALPILIRGRVFGVLELLNRIGQEQYSSSDIEILNYFTEMAARAIEVRLMLAWSKRSHQEAA